MIVQEDTVFISGMDPNLNEEDIAAHFGAIGVIKVIVVYIYFLSTKMQLTSVGILPPVFYKIEIS